MSNEADQFMYNSGNYAFEAYGLIDYLDRFGIDLETPVTNEIGREDYFELQFDFMEGEKRFGILSVVLDVSGDYPRTRHIIYEGAVPVPKRDNGFRWRRKTLFANEMQDSDMKPDFETHFNLAYPSNTRRNPLVRQGLQSMKIPLALCEAYLENGEFKKALLRY